MALYVNLDRRRRLWVTTEAARKMYAILADQGFASYNVMDAPISTRQKVILASWGALVYEDKALTPDRMGEILDAWATGHDNSPEKWGEYCVAIGKAWMEYAERLKKYTKKIITYN